MSEFDISMHLDSDIVVSPDIMKVFEQIEAGNNDNLLLKMPRHPWNGPLGNSHYQCMRYMGVLEKNQDYLHAASFIYNTKAKEFINEAYEFSNKMLQDGFHPINQDETVLNCLIWKYALTNVAIDCYDIYFENFKSKIGLKTEDQFDWKKPYTSIDNFAVNYYLAHGCKDPQDARKILERISQIFH